MHLHGFVGDAQSVSSLAVLSKQAQIFNLQNWLHSAEFEGYIQLSILNGLILVALCSPFARLRLL